MQSVLSIIDDQQWHLYLKSLSQLMGYWLFFVYHNQIIPISVRFYLCIRKGNKTSMISFISLISFEFLIYVLSTRFLLSRHLTNTTLRIIQRKKNLFPIALHRYKQTSDEPYVSVVSSELLIFITSWWLKIIIKKLGEKIAVPKGI